MGGYRMRKTENKKLQIAHKEAADAKYPQKWLYVDVDDTLVMWKGNVTKPSKKKVKVEFLGHTYFLTPNKKNIETLKKHFHSNNNYVVIWSAGGDSWARTVLYALKLERYAHYVLSKPNFYIDDRSPTYILQNNLYQV